MKKPAPLCWIAAFLLVSACSNPPVPDGAVILPGSAVDEMLRQCSRSAPDKGEKTWLPSAADIGLLEARVAADLPRYIGAYGKSELETYPNFPSQFDRQYVGIVRGGRKFIYGSIARRDETIPIDRANDVIRVCDGGPVFFGVEFDVAAKEFTHWAFNGTIGGPGLEWPGLSDERR